MNILADEQQKLFEEGLSKEELTKRTELFLELYYELRRKNEKSFLGKLTLKQRQRLHKFVLLVYKIKNRFGGFLHEIIGNKRLETKQPTIFAITHVGKFDIEVVSEAIKNHYYLLSGDFEHLQGIIDAPFLSLNGVIYFNEKVKHDRQSATSRMIELLRQGGNLMYFPEGTWNLSPNLPVLPCYWGIVDIAKQAKCTVVPVACEQYGKHFKVNIGENIDMRSYGDSGSEKARAIADLRDALATLKFEIWASEPAVCRNSLSVDEWREYVANRFQEWPYFNEEYIAGLVYKPKDVVAPHVAFAHLDCITPSKESAFLFSKRLKGDI